MLLSNKYSFITFGCKVNQYDSKKMKEKLDNLGLEEAAEESLSDIIFINTCTVTETADRKSFSALKQALSRNPTATIFMIGCSVDYHASDIHFSNKGVICLGNKEKSGIDKIVRQVVKINQPVHSRSRINPVRERSDDHQLKSAAFSNPTGIDLPNPLKEGSNGVNKNGRTRAIVKIQEGCENFCSYCIIPSVRGALNSRVPEEIIEEIKVLVNTGVKEVVLSGICLGAYGQDLGGSLDLAGLLSLIVELKGNFRVRLSSIEPKYVTDTLINLLRDFEKFCPHIHIPFQSGDDEVLKKMNRPYDSSYCIELVNRLRLEIPDVAVTTDIMVGFPGESDRNFLNSVSFLRKIKPSRIHVFPYSARRDTPASLLNDTTPAHIKLKKALFIKRLAQRYSLLYRREFLNRFSKVLIESKFDEEKGFYCGYSENYIMVHTPGASDLINTIAPVKINRVTKTHTFGEIVNPSF